MTPTVAWLLTTLEIGFGDPRGRKLFIRLQKRGWRSQKKTGRAPGKVFRFLNLIEVVTRMATWPCGRVMLSALLIALSLPAAAQSSITIGASAVLSDGDSQNANLVLAQRAALSQAATLESLSFYVTQAAGKLLLGIYDASGAGGGPGKLLAQTKSFTPVKGWNTQSVLTPVRLGVGHYWLSYLPSSNALSFVKQNNSGNCYFSGRSFSSGLPTVFPGSTASCTPTTWSFYATLYPTQQPPGDPPVNGVCGSSSGVPATSTPSANLCSAGTASAVNGTGPWNWTCAGMNGGSTTSCSAPAATGQCGPANGSTTSSAPTSGLCNVGTASAVTGSGPWTWTCSSAGAAASCEALPPSSSGGSILPVDRNASANWRMAGLLSVGGSPNHTTVCATVSPLGGGRDDTTNIQNAIEACPLGQVVSLTAGTFTIAEGNYVQLDRGVTLRGAGAGSTVLTRTGGATLNSFNPGNNPTPMILAGPVRYNNPQTGVTLTADAAQGATSIQVASTTGFSVGQIVLLDEASGAGWQPDRIWAGNGYPKIWASPDYRVVWQKHNPNYTYVDDFGPNEYPYQAGTAGCWFSNCDRPTNEIKQISAISGNTITFNSPMTISYRASHAAQLHYYRTPYTMDAGVENMTLQHGDDGNLKFEWCAYCWAKNVENTLWLGDGIDIDASFRVQLEGIYVHNAAWPVNGGGGYAISIANGSAEILIENSISVLANKVMVDRSAGAGSVVAYNYMDDGYINGSDNWIEIGINGSHMVGGHHVLFEGNYSFNTDSDQTHGNAIYHTFLRNYFSGFRRPLTTLDGTSVNDATNCCGPLRAGGAHAYAYWFSFIGNVLGTQGKMAGWVYDGIGSINNFPPTAIWMLGYMDIVPQGYDSNVASTAIRHGNYDYVTNGVTWDPNISDQNLPDSMYLSSAPAFFSAGHGYTWPWVNPTGSAQLYTLPAKARYDAGTPFTQP
jgi:hypothetical protein